MHVFPCGIFHTVMYQTRFWKETSQRLRQINDFRALRTKNNTIYLFMLQIKLPGQMMELSPQLTQLWYL